MTQKKMDPEKSKATMLVLEALAMAILMAGADKEEAIEGAATLFSAAVAEVENYKLAEMMGE